MTVGRAPRLRRIAAVAALLLALPAVARADADIDFETPALADCAAAGSQFAGLTFVTGAPESVGQVEPGIVRVFGGGAHSGTHAVRGGECSDEFPYPQLAVQLSQTRAAVSLWVKAEAAGFAPTVQLRAYDAGGTRIDANGSTYVTPAAWTQLSAATNDSTNRIATLAIVAQNPQANQGFTVLVDDVHLTDGIGGSEPDFTLGPSPVLVIQQGTTATVDVPINRLNGSSGPITFATSDRPAQIDASGHQMSETRAQVVASAGYDAPPGAGSLTLTGTPGSPAVGPAPRSTTVPIFVQTTLPAITISEPAEGTLLDRVPYDAVARGTFTSPRGGGQVCLVTTRTADVPPAPASCVGAVMSGGSGTWFKGIPDLAPGANYVHAFFRDNSGYVASATRLLRIADETTGLDLRITGVQIVQEVQSTGSAGLLFTEADGATSYRGVQLVQGKPITVRVFANTNRAARSDGRTPQVQARLHVFRDGRELALSPYMPFPVIRDLAVGGIYPTPAEVADFGAGYRFELSPTLTTGGPLTFEVEVNENFDRIPECATCRTNNRLRIENVGFRAMQTREIYPMAFFDRANGSLRSLSGTVESIFRLTREVYPFPVRVHPWVATVDITAALQEAAREIARNPEARAENWVTHFPGDYERDHNPNGPVMGVGAAGSYPGGMQTSALFCCELRIDPFAVVLESRPLTSVAHEYGHTEGLEHADHRCGGDSNGQHSDDSWPENGGTLLGVGWDRGGRRALAAFDPATGAQANYDLMSYCAENGSDSDSWLSTRNWNILAERRHARAGTRAASVRQAVKGPAGPGLAVSAVLPASGGPGVVTDVHPVDGGSQGSDPAGDVQLIIGGAAGAGSTAVVSQLVHVGAPNAHAQRLVNAVVPAGSDPRSVTLAQNGTIVASRTASANAPKVALRSVRAGSGGLRVRWTASDADGDRLTFAIDEATAPGAPFRVIAAGLTGTSTTIPLSVLRPSSRARIRIRALDGFRQGTAIATRVRIPAGPVQVAILAPLPRRVTLRADAVLAVEGQAFDAASRALTGRALVWRVDGRAVARGERADIADLAPGRHVLTLTARGSVARRTLVVTKVTPQLVTASAPARLAKSARSLTLTLAASVRGRVRVTGGTRAVSGAIGRHPGRVRIPVRPGSTTLTLTIRLTGGGGTTSARLRVPRG